MKRRYNEVKGGEDGMDSIKQLNAALAYIEANLNSEMNYKRISEIACTSEHHFQRMFSYLAGQSLGDYIKKRRLTVAGQRLQNEAVKIIDLSLDLGYSSPDAFTKAFVQWHGVTPSAVRKGAGIRCQTMLSFQIHISGGLTMNYSIKEMPDFYFAGLHDRIPLQFEGVNPRVTALYEQLTPELIMKLKAQNDCVPTGIVSASLNFSEGRMTETAELDQWVGICTSQLPSADLDYFEIEKGSWAVFEVVGTFPETLQRTWGDIFAQWFPTSSYELRKGPEILWHEGPDTSLPNFRSQIWIPVQLK